MVNHLVHDDDVKVQLLSYQLIDLVHHNHYKMDTTLETRMHCMITPHTCMKVIIHIAIASPHACI